METREPGRQGLTVSALGLGCRGMSDFDSGPAAMQGALQPNAWKEAR